MLVFCSAQQYKINVRHHSSLYTYLWVYRNYGNVSWRGLEPLSHAGITPQKMTSRSIFPTCFYPNIIA